MGDITIKTLAAHSKQPDIITDRPTERPHSIAIMILGIRDADKKGFFEENGCEVWGRIEAPSVVLSLHSAYDENTAHNSVE